MSKEKRILQQISRWTGLSEDWVRHYVFASYPYINVWDKKRMWVLKRLYILAWREPKKFKILLKTLKFQDYERYK